MASMGCAAVAGDESGDGFRCVGRGFEEELAVFGVEVFGVGSVERRLRIGDGELREFEFGLLRGFVDGWADGGGGGGAAGAAGAGQVGVAELDVDERGVDGEGLGSGLRKDGVGSGADVLRADADVDAAVGQDADDGGGGRASGSVVGGGHAVADELVAFAMLAGLRGAFGPAEALGGLGVALAEMFAGPGAALAGIFFGVVDEAKLDGVDVELFGELVEGDFEADAAGGFAGCAHPGAHAEVERRRRCGWWRATRCRRGGGLVGGAFDPVLR